MAVVSAAKQYATIAKYGGHAVGLVREMVPVLRKRGVWFAHRASSGYAVVHAPTSLALMFFDKKHTALAVVDVLGERFPRALERGATFAADAAWFATPYRKRTLARIRAELERAKLIPPKRAKSAR